MNRALARRADRIMKVLDEKKAQDIVICDTEGKGYITDCVIIATALIGKHSYALLEHLQEMCKDEKFYYIDEESHDWIIADLGDVIVHIFTDNTRKRFNLEEFLCNHFSNDMRVLKPCE